MSIRKKTKEEIFLESKVKNEKGVKKEIEVIGISSSDDDDFYCDIGYPMRWDDHHKEESVPESKEDENKKEGKEEIKVISVSSNAEFYCGIGRPMRWVDCH